MSWLRRLLGGAWEDRPPPPVADPAADAEPWPAEAADMADVFVCTTCGRSDLPEAGGWDPPICQECDAAINFDALLEHEDFGDR